MIEYKTKLSLSLQTSDCKLGQQITKSEIERIEDEISTVCSNKNANLVRDYIKDLDSSSGNFSHLGMWKLRNKLCQAQSDPPMAKLDKNGALITEPSLLKKLYLDTYTDRLKNREILPELTDLYEMKCELWRMQEEAMKLNKSKPWSVEDLEKVLKNLKNNKTRDPHGLINEIVKPGVIGSDLNKAVLNLCNGI